MHYELSVHPGSIVLTWHADAVMASTLRGTCRLSVHELRKRTFRWQHSVALTGTDRLAAARVDSCKYWAIDAVASGLF
jgi:hypothetical protein